MTPKVYSAPLSIVAKSSNLVTGGIAMIASDRLAPWFTLRAFITKSTNEPSRGFFLFYMSRNSEAMRPPVRHVILAAKA
jgi:hypothetical protein